MFDEHTKSAVLRDLKRDPRPVVVGKRHGVSHGTVRKWAVAAGITLPGREASGRAAAKTRWGDFEKRRKKARALAAQGKTGAEIAEKLGMSASGAHYAVSSAE